MCSLVEHLIVMVKDLICFRCPAVPPKLLATPWKYKLTEILKHFFTNGFYALFSIAGIFFLCCIIFLLFDVLFYLHWYE